MSRPKVHRRRYARQSFVRLAPISVPRAWRSAVRALSEEMDCPQQEILREALGDYLLTRGKLTEENRRHDSGKRIYQIQAGEPATP